MRKTRILWCHPRLMDYRKPLFDLMSKKYNVTFLFQKENDGVVNNYNAFHFGKSKLKNYVILYKKISEVDIYISSFIWKDYSILGISFAKLYKKKIILWEEKWYWENINFKIYIKNFLSKFIGRFVDAFYVVGDIQQKGLESVGIKKEKIFVTNEYTGVNYGKIEKKEINILSKGKKNILYFGRFIEVKGIEYIVDAFRILEQEKRRTDFVLNIIGYGPLETILKEKVKKSNLHSIKFHKPIFDINVKAYIFSNSHIAIVPSVIDSKGNAEGGPIIVFEFLSAGLPVIASSALGCSKKLIKDQLTGKVVKMKSAEEIADAVIELDKMINSHIITKQSVMNEFDKLPGYNNQFNILKEAIDYVVKRS